MTASTTIVHDRAVDSELVTFGRYLVTDVAICTSWGLGIPPAIRDWDIKGAESDQQRMAAISGSGSLTPDGASARAWMCWYSGFSSPPGSLFRDEFAPRTFEVVPDSWLLGTRSPLRRHPKDSAQDVGRASWHATQAMR